MWSSPTKVWVSRSRGLPRSINTVSNIASSLWHFQSYSSIAEALAILLAVTIAGPPAYFFTEHEHYKHLSLCEHGLSSTDISQPQSPEIYKCDIKLNVNQIDHCLIVNQKRGVQD